MAPAKPSELLQRKGRADCISLLPGSCRDLVAVEDPLLEAVVVVWRRANTGLCLDGVACIYCVRSSLAEQSAQG
jgi:hypothetical protein